MKDKSTRTRGTTEVGISFALALLITGALAAQQNFVPEEATISGIHAAVAAGQITCIQVVQAYLNRIQAYDHQGPALNAIIAINPKALETAAEMDRLNAANRSALKPLHCIPVILKDNYDTADMPTTGGIIVIFQNDGNAMERLQRRSVRRIEPIHFGRGFQRLWVDRDDSVQRGSLVVVCLNAIQIRLH